MMNIISRILPQENLPSKNVGRNLELVQLSRTQQSISMSVHGQNSSCSHVVFGFWSVERAIAVLVFAID